MRIMENALLLRGPCAGRLNTAREIETHGLGRVGRSVEPNAVGRFDLPTAATAWVASIFEFAI